MSTARVYLILILPLILTGCWHETDQPILDNTNPLRQSDSEASNSAINESENEVVQLDIYYIGYGSNMNVSQMNARCGSNQFVDLGQATLEDYRFYFFDQGYANIKPDSSTQVEGVLHKISEQCLRDLDRVEGYPNLYQRRVVRVAYQGKTVLAQVYIVENDNTTSIPSNSYYDTVITGAEEHDLSQSYINYIKGLAGH